MLRSLKAILAFVMVISIFMSGSVAVFAERIEHTREDTEIEWNYDEATETIYFTGYGRIPDYYFEGCIFEDYEGDPSEIKSHRTPWDDYSEITKHIVFEEGITEIGWYCFTEFENLETMTIPKSMVEIYDAFPRFKRITIIAHQLTAAELAATEYRYDFSPLSNIVRGDVDNSGGLDADDALSILKMSAKLTATYCYTADITEDGIVNAEDALLVLKKVAKLR